MARVSTRNWLVTAGCAALCTFGIAPAIGVGAPAATDAVADETATATEQEPWQYLEGMGIENIYNAKEQRAADYAPEVITLEDGRQVQRTPDSGDSYWYTDAPSAYNTYYLKADQRGCESCHTEGLAKSCSKATPPWCTGPSTTVWAPTSMPWTASCATTSTHATTTA